MNDIKLGISKSRGYENVDLETLCNEKTPQDVQDQGEFHDKGQIIVLDPDKQVVAVISNTEIIEYKGYQVILDKNEDYKFTLKEEEND